MKNLLLVLAVCGFAFFALHRQTTPFEHPLPLAAVRPDSGVAQYEFERLLENETSFEELAEPGYYTIVEGYTDSCGICRALERTLPSLLSARTDVVLRRVRFREHGGKQFRGASEAEIRAGMAAYATQLKRYRSFHVAETDEDFELGTCGTPHVEIYRPDGSLLASDFCDSRVHKDGLDFLRQWIATEGRS